MLGLHRPTRRRVGYGWVIRNRDGTATFVCQCGTCTTYQPWQATWPRWRDAVRAARQHQQHYVTENGPLYLDPAPAAGTFPGRRTPRRRRHWLATAVVVLLLAALAFMFSVNLTSHAAPPPAPPTTIGAGYVPTPAGPPATDQSGRWTGQPAPATPRSSSTVGGGR